MKEILVCTVAMLAGVVVSPWLGVLILGAGYVLRGENQVSTQ